MHSDENMDDETGLKNVETSTTQRMNADADASHGTSLTTGASVEGGAVAGPSSMPYAMADVFENNAFYPPSNTEMHIGVYVGPSGGIIDAYRGADVNAHPEAGALADVEAYGGSWNLPQYSSLAGHASAYASAPYQKTNLNTEYPSNPASISAVGSDVNMFMRMNVGTTNVTVCYMPIHCNCESYY